MVLHNYKKTYNSHVSVEALYLHSHFYHAVCYTKYLHKQNDFSSVKIQEIEYSTELLGFMHYHVKQYDTLRHRLRI